MKLLKELVDIVTRQRVEKVTLIDLAELEDQQSQYARFYNAIRNGEVKSDQDAARTFYDSDTTDDRYRKLKSRFKKRMLNYLFFLDINKNSYSDYLAARHTCFKNLLICRVLKTSGARYSFEKIAKQTLSQAEKFNLNSIIVPLTSDLLTHYSLLAKRNDYDKTLQQFEQAQQELQGEYAAERYMEQVVLEVTSSNTKVAPVINMAKENCRKLDQLAAQYPGNYRIQHLTYYTKAIYYQMIFDFKALIEVCDAAEHYYNTHKEFYQRSALAQFSLMRMAALLNLRDYTKGLHSIKQSLAYLDEGNPNWLLTMEAYFLLAMQAGKYPLAADIFLQVVNHARFKYFSEIRLEKWRIFHAYLHYIFEVNKMDKRQLRNKYIPNFNIEQFLNNTPHATKDKSGLNMAVISLKIQYLLKDGKLDTIFDKMDALNIYAYRHLNKKENLRAYTYIKMLQAAEKKSFVYRYVESDTADMHRKLRSQTDRYSAEWEILPYEVMWEQALGFMKAADKAQ